MFERAHFPTFHGRERYAPRATFCVQSFFHLRNGVFAFPTQRSFFILLSHFQNLFSLCCKQKHFLIVRRSFGVVVSYKLAVLVYQPELVNLDVKFTVIYNNLFTHCFHLLLFLLQGCQYRLQILLVQVQHKHSLP